MSDPTPDPQAAAHIAKVRRLMTTVTAATVFALAAVLGAIGYRLFHVEGSAQPPADLSAALPAGAKVLSSAVGDGRIVLTVEINGAIEIRSFDLKTLRPLGRMRLAPQP